ncbi:transcription factor [Recurvomyces mirabilis]|uniref:Transcription factor n=1 Tax=Recurvomyces mirabilis TaxID=574656 RepID=A0AAE0WN72_9PEZI|nr:transcription factor [Recurvomyces mirabilis]KAK5152654.1 transcription factor [Recurvomyces mirabilis]
MPQSGRKGKTRARRVPAAAEPHEPSDAETPEAIATPSRASRKRARESEAAAPPARSTRRRKTRDTRAHEREDTEGTEAQEQSDDETEPALPNEQDIIQNLRIAERKVNATEDFSNNLLLGQENVPGYGKIAGRDWTFIIRKVEVNIGRPEAQEKLESSASKEPAKPTAKTIIDIDLGPDRQISRLHAIIGYDSDAYQWFVIVNGRNGVRVDNNVLKRGHKSYLRNGSVIEIANTQMAFITTPAENGDGPVWDASIIKQAQKSSEDDDEGDDDMKAPNGRSHALGGRATLSQPGFISSASLGEQQQQQRTHPHSQRAMQGSPGTPHRPQQSVIRSSPAANYARGVMMESTESIDYSADTAKDLKPPHSYAQLIGMAILSTHEQQMTLNNIYKWIMANYAFYRFNTGGWQNSIRHNLSLNKAFTKIARRTDEPGKGMKWMIEPTEFDTFVQQGMKGCRRPAPLPATQSTLDSPISPMHANRFGHSGHADEDITPPLHPYHPMYLTANEAYTPDRGSKQSLEGRIGLGINSETVDYDALARSTPRNGLTFAANAAGSPPALYINDETRTGFPDTPFPLRPSQRLAPPSTLKRPSDFIQFSSPAPFWKMEGLAGIGSTPWKPYDLSPLKTPFSQLKKTETEGEDVKEGDTEVASAEDEKDEEGDGEVGGKGSPVVPSSSPPRPQSSSVPPLEASPTLSRPATAVAKTLSQMASGIDPVPAQDDSATSDSIRLSRPASQHSGPSGAAPSLISNGAGSSISPALPTPSLQPAAQLLQGPNVVVEPQMNGYHTSAPHPSQQQPLPSSQHSYSHTHTHTHAHDHHPAHSGMPAVNGFHVVDDGEDEGIDLAKGFQPIGTFHQRNHMAVGMGASAGYGR